MRRVVTLDLWPHVRRLSKQAKRRIAAVAYVTSDAEVQFGAGDILVVDASNQAIKGGATSSRILRAAHDRRARLFNCPGLHAKLLLLDGVAVIGSANISSASVNRKIEAALITDEASITRSVESVIHQLARKSEEIDERFLRRIAKIEVAERRPESTRATGISLDPGRTSPNLPGLRKRRQNTGNERIVRNPRKYGVIHELLERKGVRLDTPLRLPFLGKTFAFTGRFWFGPRRECIQATISRGGSVSPGNMITRDVDFLVVGEEGNPQYLWDTFGTKIAKAADLRREFKKPQIISEELWAKSVKRGRRRSR